MDGTTLPRLIPVWITLTEFAASLEGKESLIVAIARKWGLASALAENVLYAGRGLILLDGLDEVSDRDYESISDAIRVLADSFPHSHIIVTCRTGRDRRLFDGFVTLYISPFNSVQIAEYLNRCLDLHGIRRERVLRNIRSSIWQELAGRPLLLALFCVLSSHRENNITSEADLYKECIDLLVWEWDASRGVRRSGPVSVSGAQLERLLREIAYDALVKQDFLIRRRDIEMLIRDFFGRGGTPTSELAARPKAILAAVESNFGLLTKIDGGTYRFTHASLQTYLAAEHCVNNLAALRDCDLNNLHRNFFHLLLATGRDEAVALALKRQVDEIMLAHSQLVRCLSWCNRFASRNNGQYRASAMRAIALEVMAALLSGAEDRDGGFDTALAPAKPSIRCHLGLPLTRMLDEALFSDVLSNRCPQLISELPFGTGLTLRYVLGRTRIEADYYRDEASCRFFDEVETMGRDLGLANVASIEEVSTTFQTAIREHVDAQWACNDVLNEGLVHYLELCLKLTRWIINANFLSGRVKEQMLSDMLLLPEDADDQPK